MLFNSYFFLFLFLPVTLAGYYILNYVNLYRAAGIFLIGMSLWFYGYFNPSYLFILCGSIVANFLFAKGMDRLSEKGFAKKGLLVFGICANVALIFYFKYFDFFLENMNALFGTSFPLKNILLPLGISFFTFQQISFLVDSYRGETKGYTFDEYALFVSFFPQLVAGPVVLHKETIPQFRMPEKRRIHYENLSRGIYVFALGLFKKMIIADTFGRAADYGFPAVASLNTAEAFIVSLCYTFQLYFDFSGYCDMAVGIGSLFNITLPENFNAPYRATSVMEFWKRWHMSLTRFLRTYIYFPLGGSRKGTLRTYCNIMIVYLVSGIWHGANWTFIVWGLLHGLCNCLNRMFRRQWDRLWKPVRWAVTFLTLNFLTVFFRVDSLAMAGTFFKRIFRFRGFSLRPELTDCFRLEEWIFLEKRIPLFASLQTGFPALYLGLFMLSAFLIVLFVKTDGKTDFKPTLGKSVATVLCLLWSVLSLEGISAFLYFNF